MTASRYGPTRNIALATTYVVVLFSVIVQRGTIGRLLERQSVVRPR